MKKIKVMCDAKVFINGINDRHKTGLFYTQLSIWNQFLKKNNIELELFIEDNLNDEQMEKLFNITSTKNININYLNSKLLRTLHKTKLKLLKSNRKTLSFHIKRFFLSLFIRIIKIIPYKISSKENYNIYQSFFYPIPELIKKFNIKPCIFIHDLIPLKHPEFFQSKEDKLANPIGERNRILDSIGKNTLIFCNTEFTKKDLLSVRPELKNNRIVVTSLGVDKNKFFLKKNRNNKNSKDWLEIQNSLKKYNIPTDKPYFLSLCALIPQKNLEFTLKCFIKFLKQNPKADVNFVIGGPKGSTAPLLSEIINKNKKYKNNIIMPNYINDKDINNIYNGALAFIYPSLYEGFGMPIIEAMQCGIPVISSNASCLPEVAGNAGILIDPKKEKDFINAFKKLYTNKKLREELKQKSLKRTKDFSWEKVANIMEKEYQKNF